MRTPLLPASWAVALLAGVLPLWVGRHLPMVDLPQHLHLISVIHRLDDPTTLYPGVFALRGGLTPYLAYYYAVHWMSWLVPLESANKLFLSAYVVGMPLSAAFLLRSFGRPAWPSLLTLPFAYGDSFAWGFVNYCAALPVTLLTLGFCVWTLGEPGRIRWPVLLGSSLVLVLLLHVQAFLFLMLGLPVLWLTTRAPAGPFSLASWLRARRPAILAAVPGAALFLVWVADRLRRPAALEVGVPWKAWGPMLSARNLSYKTFARNGSDLVGVLANALRDGSDRWAVYAAFTVWLAALAAWLLSHGHPEPRTSLLDRSRPALLAALALLLFFTLPFDIRGYVYYLNTRYAHLAAVLAMCCVPSVAPPLERAFRGAAIAVAVVLGLALARGFRAFDGEASAWDAMASRVSPRPRVMGLIFDPFARTVNHPVFLHSAAVLAREGGGLANFGFASTPHSPVMYRGEPPPTFPSEWRPDAFRYEVQGPAYDHFLVRGATPEQVFGDRLKGELETVAHSGSFWLLRRR